MTQKNIFIEDDPSEKKQSSFSAWWWGAFSFLAVFFVCILFTNAFLQRKVFISQLKKQIMYSIEALNQSGWDLAYDYADFNAFPLFPLAEFDNVKIYNRQKPIAWNCQNISFNNSIINPGKLIFQLEGKQFLSFDTKVHDVKIANLEIFSEHENNGNLKKISLKILDLSISDLADIEQIIFNCMQTETINSVRDLPSLKNILEIKNIKLNGLLNYPLTQTIKRIFIDSEIIGKINFENNFHSDLREWMLKDGHININDFNLNWPPLLMVGKGSLYFNENFKPILQLNTTSKALNVLIEDLESKNWLDSKGVFVAKILLSGKSYKSDEDDEHLTVTTPISLRDDALLVEKIAVKKFN